MINSITDIDLRFIIGSYNDIITILIGTTEELPNPYEENGIKCIKSNKVKDSIIQTIGSDNPIEIVKILGRLSSKKIVHNFISVSGMNVSLDTEKLANLLVVDLDVIKSKKQIHKDYLKTTDWYVIRKMERNIDIPQDVSTQRMIAIDFLDNN